MVIIVLHFNVSFFSFRRDEIVSSVCNKKETLNKEAYKFPFKFTFCYEDSNEASSILYEVYSFWI